MEIFIAVVVVLLVLDGFFFLVLRGMVSTVEKFAQNNVLRQAGIYDELIVKKEEALHELQRQIDSLEARKPATGGLQAEALLTTGDTPNYAAISAGSYKDAEFVQEYREIRSNFVFDRNQVIQQVLAEIPDAGSHEATVAQSILDSVSADDCYQLSTLPGEDQIAVLTEVFNSEQRVLFDQYLEAGSYFECFEFVNWLRQIVFEKSPQIVVRTSHQTDNFDGIDGRIHTKYDEELCEGISIVSKGKLYDYSIRNKEIVG